MTLRVTTAGNAKPWESRTSDHVRNCGHRRHVFGPIQSMDEPGFLRRLFGAKK